MGFFEDAAADASEILGDIGQVVTYTPHGGTPSTVTALWSPQDRSPQSHEDGREQRLTGVVQVHPTDAPAPEERDSFTIDGAVYAVERIETTRPLVVFHVFKLDQRRFGGGDAYKR